MASGATRRGVNWGYTPRGASLRARAQMPLDAMPLDVLNAKCL